MSKNKQHGVSRRRFVRQAAILSGSMAFSSALPAWARSGLESDSSGISVLSGKVFDLSVSSSSSTIDGIAGQSILVNGQLPAPLLRWREGDDVTLRVTNHLKVDTSIHWHGILLPFQMDGVPGVAFPGIKPGQTFTYQFPVLQAGTYWYHSHSGLQEQSGHYGPIIIEPKERDPVSFDREYIVVLSDWTFEDPHRIFAKLKKMSHVYNFQQRTVGDFFAEADADGIGTALADRAMWGAMRMNPADIADVTAATYTYLINGHSATDNWTGLFNPGERVRLRFINASAMSIFNVRIPGLPMTIVQADGLNVEPVETDEFQIGTAETYDVIVSPQSREAFTLMAESIDRSGYVRATLAPEMGMLAAVQPLRARPTLTMKDMAMEHHHMDEPEPEVKSPTVDHREMDHSTMDHSSMAHPGDGHAEMDHAAMDHATMDHSSMAHTGSGHAEVNHAEMDHADMDHTDMDQTPKSHSSEQHDMHGSDTTQSHDHPKGAGVVGLAKNPTNRLSERPIGLEEVPHRVLVYTDLRSLEQNPDTRMPEREMELHLTSNMERYMWSFDGQKFSEVDGPIMFHKDERLRLTMVNDTMMPHPIHLHGMFFDVVTGDHAHKPRKHTIVVKPGEKMSVDITADAVGDWAFHCHLLYHMHAGMMRIVSVVDHHTPA